MKTTTLRLPVFEVARLACEIWQQETRPSIREQEYWLWAVAKLRAVPQPDDSAIGNAHAAAGVFPSA